MFSSLELELWYLHRNFKNCAVAWILSGWRTTVCAY